MEILKPACHNCVMAVLWNNEYYCNITNKTVGTFDLCDKFLDFRRNQKILKLLNLWIDQEIEKFKELEYSLYVVILERIKDKILELENKYNDKD